MKKDNLNPLKLLTFGILLGSFLSLGCERKDEISPLMLGTGSSPAGQPTSGAGAGAGTTDGGGGNAINNQMIESYIVDPKELSAYKEIITPIFESWSGQSPDEEIDMGMMLFKTWYMAPIDLKVIENSTLGLSFSDTETQQVALQTKDAVWINKDLFEQLSPENQARLILHEIVMTTYLIQFMTYDEFCKIGSSDCGPFLTEPIYQSLFKPQAVRPLVAKDYESIRKVTEAVISRNIQSADELRSLLYQQGFGHIYGLDNNAEEPHVVSAPFSKVVELFQRDQLTARLPQECVGIKSEETQPCTISLEVLSSEDEFTKLLLTVHFKNSGKTITQTLAAIGLDEAMDLYTSIVGSDAVVNTVLVPFLMDEEVKVGDVYYGLGLNFRIKNGELIRLEYVTVYPQIVTNTDLKKVNGEISKVCHLNEVGEYNTSLDTYIQGHPSTYRNLIQGIYNFPNSSIQACR